MSNCWTYRHVSRRYFWCCSVRFKLSLLIQWQDPLWFTHPNLKMSITLTTLSWSAWLMGSPCQPSPGRFPSVTMSNGIATIQAPSMSLIPSLTTAMFNSASQCYSSAACKESMPTHTHAGHTMALLCLESHSKVAQSLLQ